MDVIDISPRNAPPDLAESEDLASVARRRYEQALAAHEELSNEADTVIDGYIIRLRRTWHEVEACQFDLNARLADIQKARAQ